MQRGDTLPCLNQHKRRRWASTPLMEGMHTDFSAATVLHMGIAISSPDEDMLS